MLKIIVWKFSAQNNIYSLFYLWEEDKWSYSQICVKRPYNTTHIFGFSDRWLLSALLSFSNKLSIVISMSPEWMVT